MDLKALERPGIYVILHVASGRSYVGSSVNVRVRRKTHLGALRHGRHYNTRLQRAWDKYGESAFEFNVLEWVERADVLVAEQRWIDRMQPAFNVLSRAGSPIGFKLSAEQRAKISESNRRRMANVTPERLEAMRQHMREIAKKSPRKGPGIEGARKAAEANRGKPSPLRGRKRSREFAAKIAAARAGSKLSPEHRAAIAAGLRGKKRGPYDLSTEEIERRRTWGKGVPLSSEHRAAIAAGLTGRKRGPMPAEHKERLRQVNLGAKHSPEHRDKIRAKLVGREKSAAERANIAAALTGKKKSPEHRAAMAVAQQARRAKDKADTAA
jgi:group I intron endonuclease